MFFFFCLWRHEQRVSRVGQNMAAKTAEPVSGQINVILGNNTTSQNYEIT